MRLFWAVNLPEEIKANLQKTQENLHAFGTAARWVTPQNLHITVKFLGETDKNQVSKIVDLANRELRAIPPFCLEVSGLGFFYSHSGPRVLWASLQGELQVLKKIASKLEESMAICGFSKEKRPFAPHLTLARISSSKDVSDLVQAVKEQSPHVQGLGRFTVTSVDLMHSILQPQGPVYNRLASVQLSTQR